MCFGCSKEPSQETVLLSTHNICFEIIFQYTHLSDGLLVVICMANGIIGK